MRGQIPKSGPTFPKLFISGFIQIFYSQMRTKTMVAVATGGWVCNFLHLKCPVYLEQKRRDATL